MPSRLGAETKPPWRNVPAVVRRRVEELAGGRVRRAARVWGGYAPSPTFRLLLDGGARLFFKASSPASNEFMHRALKDEERVYRDLETWMRPWAPAFYGSFQAAEWHVVLLEDVGPASVPPWTRAAVEQAMLGFADFHRHTLGRDLPDWLSRRGHHGFARKWTELAAEPGGLKNLAGLAGDRRVEALEWTRAMLPRMQAAAEGLVDVNPPHVLLHFDTRSDNLRLQSGGQLRLFDWPFACVGPAEVDVAAFAQSITCEDGPARKSARALRQPDGGSRCNHGQRRGRRRGLLRLSRVARTNPGAAAATFHPAPPAESQPGLVRPSPQLAGARLAQRGGRLPDR